MMNILTVILLSFFIAISTTNSFAENKKDCTHIDKDTGSGWLKSALCKRGSDKLDEDGNFKKSTFNLFKKFKKS
jgi:hypothetical protein